MTQSENNTDSSRPKLRLVPGAIVLCALLPAVLFLHSVFVRFVSDHIDVRQIMHIDIPVCVFSVCFAARLFRLCGWRHLLLFFVVPVSITLIADGPADLATYKSIAEFVLIILVPGMLGIGVAFRMALRANTPARRWAAILVAVALILAVPTSRLVRDRLRVRTSSTYAEVMQKPDLSVNARDLKNTLVVPTMEWPVTAGTNLIWCATFQEAWNKLCDLAGQPLQTEPSSPVADALNSKTVTSADLDLSTYIAVAGSVGDGTLNTIQNELQNKFPDAASARLAPSPGSLPDDWLVTYAYLLVNLPFEWAFERFQAPLTFGETEVKCFGIDQYLRSQEKEDRAAQQILIFDARNEDDFILELKTRRAKHHLYLAKVKPLDTLAATVSAVRKRIAASKPDTLDECQNFMVPLVNFDILRDYDEITGRRLVADNPRYRDLQVALARQQIRFLLDERGAVLESEGEMHVKALDMDLIFDKPFLITLWYAESTNPYFAMWVDNPEVLVHF